MSLVSPFGFLFRHLFLRRHANTAIPTVSFSQFFCIIVLCIMFPAPCCCYYPHHQRVSISQLHTTIATIRIPFPAIHYPYVRPFSILPNPPPPFVSPSSRARLVPARPPHSQQYETVNHEARAWSHDLPSVFQRVEAFLKKGMVLGVRGGISDADSALCLFFGSLEG